MFREEHFSASCGAKAGPASCPALQKHCSNPASGLFSVNTRKLSWIPAASTRLTNTDQPARV